MGKKVNLFSSVFLYVIASLVLIFYFIIGLNSQITEMARVMFLGVSALFLYFGGFLLSKYLGNNKPLKINLYIFFILYLILLITLTLFDSLWLRNGFSFAGFNNISERVNLIPFKTIMMFISQFDSMYSTSQIMFNLFGNVLAFMPMAFFLPLLFKRQNKFKWFLLTVTLIILGTEFLQLITGSGRCDVDDLILNLTGSVLLYFLLKIKSVNNLIRNIFLLEKNKISKKAYIKIILFIIGVIALFMGIIVYRNSLYNKNYEEYNKINNPDITFKYDKKCTNNNLLYEDDIYKYYFKCLDSSKFKVIVNGKYEFSVKDLLDNSKYNYDIDRLLDNFDYSDIEYEIKHKYTYFDIELENNLSNSYYAVNVVDGNIASLCLVDKTTDENKLKYEVNIIPKKSGKEIFNIDFEFTSPKGKVKMVTKKVSVTVDDDLKVTYSLD